MNDVMALPSPKTPSLQRAFHVTSPRFIEIYHTPRSEGFRRRKCTAVSPGTVGGNEEQLTQTLWMSETPPKSSSSVEVSVCEKLRNPNTEVKSSKCAIPENRFYCSATKRKALLPLFKDSQSLLRSRADHLDEDGLKSSANKRKRSKSLDYRKRNDTVKISNNVRHKIKRPKLIKPKHTPVSTVPNKFETREVELPTTVTCQGNRVNNDIKETPTPDSSKLVKKPKNLSVNVNKMVRVNIRGGELRFTKHKMSPKKPSRASDAKKDDSMNTSPDLCEDWLQNKVENIICNLDQENHMVQVEDLMNDESKDRSSSLNDSASNLSDAFLELGVKELEDSSSNVQNNSLSSDSDALEVYGTATGAKNTFDSILGQSSTENGNKKFFPVFYRPSPDKMRVVQKADSSHSSPKFNFSSSKCEDGMEQLIIDAGQKSLGSSNCPECGFFYQRGYPDEEKMHIMYHESSKPVVKHTGWKWERVALKCGDNRVVQVCPGDPKAWWSKVEAVLQKANDDLGITFDNKIPKNAHAYFFVSNMLIQGIVIAEPIRVAYRMLESDRKEIEKVKEPGEDYMMDTPSFCSNTPVRGSRCGINRIWICASERRKGIATKLLDAIRATFVYGHILKLSEIAFSDPTPLGMAFALKYTKTSNFLVYKMNKD